MGNQKKQKMISKASFVKTTLSRLNTFKTVRFYDQKVLNYFENPPNVGKLDKKKSNVGTGVVGSIACGDQLKFQVEVNEETGKIEQAVFKAFGCGSAIAASAYATELIKGKTLDEAREISNMDISQYLKLPPVKLHCSLLAEEAIKKSLDNYQSKNNKKTEQAEAF